MPACRLTVHHAPVGALPNSEGGSRKGYGFVSGGLPRAWVQYTEGYTTSSADGGSETVAAKAQRILLVEDEDDIRAALATLLADEGYEVLAAPDGFDGLAALDGIEPDIIILDWQMPVIDGGRFIHALRDEWKLATPVLVITAGRASREEALGTGADDFLAKPFDLDDLLAKVRALSARARAP